MEAFLKDPVNITLSGMTLLFLMAFIVIGPMKVVEMVINRFKPGIQVPGGSIGLDSAQAASQSEMILQQGCPDPACSQSVHDMAFKVDNMDKVLGEIKSDIKEIKDDIYKRVNDTDNRLNKLTGYIKGVQNGQQK